MDPNGMPYHISLNFDEDVGYGFNDASVPEPCSAVSFGGSSYASSSFGPHTPLSSPSTPSRSGSLDYGSSFASSIDGLSFEPSPPSSATSTYFPTSLKTSDVSDFAHPSFPMTPPRGQLRFSGHPISGCGAPLAPSPMDFCLYMNGLGSQSLLSTPSGLVKLDEPSDAWSIFLEPDSPISRSKKRSAPRLLEPFEPIKVEDEDVMTPPSTPWAPPRKRSRMEDVRQRTADLRKAQQRPQSDPRARERRSKQRLAPAMESDGMITLAKAGAHKCDWEGCDAKPFQRREHMKRHVTSVHLKVGWSYCEFCNNRPFNRVDNYITHMRLHTLNRGSGKAQYVPAAVEEYKRLIKARKIRKFRKRRAEDDAISLVGDAKEARRSG
ncbi:hypothetical protein MFIFM68171_03825 [Madurella fahalii]|uniref:C2H2-type domain-containing protein n=1 Tax=Madurella fahalii TaxID=1157608 RepID=A0ABQ0G7B9_9PEZI